MIYPVILCGGSGTRLWPLSRKSYPKQFLDLQGSGYSLLQETVQRLRGLEAVAPLTFVCNKESRFLVAQQLQEIGVQAGHILLEPVAKNTAPAIACAALKLLETDPEATLLVLPSDHVISDERAFHEAVVRADQAAEDGSLVTFGVPPSHPETGYGYIQKGAALAQACFEIECFVEKPALEVAEAYVADGGYCWNSGMFVFSAQTYLAELHAQRPSIVEHCKKAVSRAREDLDFLCLDEEYFAQCEADSIDYAVMESAKKRVVVDLDVGWSDLGSWSSLWAISDQDEQKNVFKGDVLSLDSESNFIFSSNRLIATLGVENLVVVDSEDALLVAAHDRVQDVKKVVEQLSATSRTEAVAHDTVHRPWGAYTSICDSERFQVKRIIVAPGQKLSLQKHHHRAEHWIVVSGTARVTCEEKVFDLAEDQSTYIPLGHKHRLENPGVIPLEIIEVQSGSYLGEDDIVRYDDVYGRETP